MTTEEESLALALRTRLEWLNEVAEELTRRGYTVRLDHENGAGLRVGLVPLVAKITRVEEL